MSKNNNYIPMNNHLNVNEFSAPIKRYVCNDGSGFHVLV